MEDIPDSYLLPYLDADVVATHELYIAQGKEAPYANQVLPLAAMELAGMEIDKPATKQLMTTLSIDSMKLEKSLLACCDIYLRTDKGTAINTKLIKFNAPRTISYILTGQPAGGFKLGKDQIVLDIGPLLEPSIIVQHFGKLKPSNLGYSMSESVLTKVLATIPSSIIASLYIKQILEYRKISKLKNTYIGPILEKIDPAYGTTAIHPKIHMVSTDTGRCSSSDPNGQNFPPQARACIKATHAWIHEIDFKQLEVLVLALLSKDPMLIADIKAGRDLHYETGKSVYGWQGRSDMSDKYRKIVKGVNFGLIYGGGAKGIAAQTGTSIKVVKELMTSFYARYTRVGEWQEEFYTMVANSMVPAGHVNGEQIYSSLVTLPLGGRKFYFKEKPSPIWLKKKTGRSFSFKPTETKNYPVQGFAGGDLVMLAIRLLYDEIKRHNLQDTQLIMTVHDSIIIDSIYKAGRFKTIMDMVCSKIERVYRMPFRLEFDIKSGTHWS